MIPPVAFASQTLWLEEKILDFQADMNVCLSTGAAALMLKITKAGLFLSQVYRLIHDANQIQDYGRSSRAQQSICAFA